jgi:hypothetical protein
MRLCHQCYKCLQFIFLIGYWILHAPIRPFRWWKSTCRLVSKANCRPIKLPDDQSISWNLPYWCLILSFLSLFYLFLVSVTGMGYCHFRGKESHQQHADGKPCQTHHSCSGAQASVDQRTSHICPLIDYHYLCLLAKLTLLSRCL